VNPDDVTIEMRREELRISGQFEQRERSGVMRRQSRQQGEFEYVVDRPVICDWVMSMPLPDFESWPERLPTMVTSGPVEDPKRCRGRSRPANENVTTAIDPNGPAHSF
jgi:hypothetical protein